MPVRKETLKDRLSRLREITISVTGRKSGRTVSMPVWFVLEAGTLYLLPVRGSDTQWYKNVLKKPAIQIEAGRAEAELKVVSVTDAKEVTPVIERFRTKYGESGIRLYKKLDVAVIAKMR